MGPRLITPKGPTSRGKVRKFRKKPVTIEAMQVTPESVFEWAFGEWAGTKIRFGGMTKNTDRKIIQAAVLIDTLEGTMRAELGDWIIKGIQGEFYPCKPDIFEATYEECGL